MRLQVGERLRAPALPVARDPRHRQGRVVIEDRSRHSAEEGEGADMLSSDNTDENACLASLPIESAD